MKKIISGLFSAAILLLAVSFQTHAQGLVYDQQSATGPTSPSGVDFFDVQPHSPLLQSFTPSLSAIGFVQFEFADFSGNGNNGATVYVNLWTGSPNINSSSATLLSSTMPVYMPNGFGSVFAGVTNFYFSTSITLTAGQTYYLQPVVSSGDNPWDILVLGNVYPFADAYPNGQLYAEGSPFDSNIDFWFREGVVPEPSALALVGLGALLIYTFKRRFKLVVLLLFVIPVLSVHASDSVVQATADAAGLAPAATLSPMGTFWVMTVSPDGGLMESPYPFLPSNLSTLPIYAVVNDIFMVDNTGGQLMPSSSGRMSSAKAMSTAQSQAESMASLIDLIQTNSDNQSFQPNNFISILDTNGLWFEALNEAPYLGLRLHNTMSGDNYQLLSTTNLSNNDWALGEVLTAHDTQMDFSPLPMTNSIAFFKAQRAHAVMEIVNVYNSTEPNPTNDDPGYAGYISIYNEGWATNDVTVYYTIGGTAQNGIDYSNLTGAATISNGQSSVKIDIEPTADGLNS